MTDDEKAVVKEAVEELDLEHYPTWYDAAAKTAGKKPLGCDMCWPKDGSWPCISRLIADDLRKLIS